MAQIATSGLVAARRDGQDTDRSLTSVTAVLPGPQYALTSTSSWLQAAEQAALSQLTRMTRTPLAAAAAADGPAEPAEKRRLHLRTGAVAVDTESHVAARIAAAHRIPFAACRAVIDPAHSVLPPAAVFGLRHDGTADVIAVLRSLARQPSQLPALARTALDARVAAAALRRGRRLLGAGLAFPYFEELALDAKLAVEMT